MDSSQVDDGLAGLLGPRQADRDAVCAQHGAYVAKHLLRQLWAKCPTCADEAKAEADALKNKELAERREKAHRDMLLASAIPTRFIGRTFDVFTAPTPGHTHALTVARDYAEQFAENARAGKGLILAGMPGTGKSHLAGAILQHLMPRHDVHYITCMDMIRAVRETWRRDSEKTESQVLSFLQNIDLLAIDEIGMQYGTDGEQTILFDVLDRRYREVMPTLVLTNQDQPGLRKFVGDRTFDRLTETCRWVPFDWPSHRSQRGSR